MLLSPPPTLGLARASGPPRVDGPDHVEPLIALLRSPDTNERVFARRELAVIFERRGMLDLAAECYEHNIADGVRDPDQCDRLASLYERLPAAPRPALAPQVADHDEQADAFLVILRSGDPDDRAAARAGLATIFERRGMLDLAAECYELNIADGVRDPDQCRRLAAAYRRVSGQTGDAGLPAHTSAAPAPAYDTLGPANGQVVRLRSQGASINGHAGSVNVQTSGDSVATPGADAHPLSARPAREPRRSISSIGPPRWPAGHARALASEALADPLGLLRRPLAVALLYLVAITAGEVLTVIAPRFGLMFHGALLLLLLVHGSIVADDNQRALLWGFALAPLIRLSSLSMPLVRFPPVYWYAIISVPIFASVFVTARMLGYSRHDLGLTLTPRTVPATLVLVPLCIGLGLGEYLILHPEPLSRELSLSSLWLPAVILSVSTGFEEELLFRGLLQRAAPAALGLHTGLIVVSLLFAVLHIGYWSIADLIFVFAVGHVFALVARWSGSIVAPTLGHAAVNVSMFAIWPFVLPIITGTA